MAFKAFLVRGKLQRIRRQVRRIHFLQKRARKRLEALEEERRKGLDKGKYVARKAAIEAERRDLVTRLAAVEAEEKALREQLRAIEAPA